VNIKLAIFIFIALKISKYTKKYGITQAYIYMDTNIHTYTHVLLNYTVAAY